FERAQQEFAALYRVLQNPHPHIVKVRWSSQLRDYDDTPFILFEYLEGKDLEEVLASRDLSLEEAVQVLEQTAQGIAYLHQANIYHQDIKPSNLLMTEQGIKIIDFNVSVTSSDESAITAGTRRYLPPGFKPSIEPSKEDRIDRDLYALGITAYECMTGRYPFNAAQPVIGQACHDPSLIKGCEYIGEGLSLLLQRAIAPNRTDRFQSAQELLDALSSIKNLRRSSSSEESSLKPLEEQGVEENSPAVEPISSKGVEIKQDVPGNIAIEQPVDLTPSTPASVSSLKPLRSPIPIAAETSFQIQPPRQAAFSLFTLLPSGQQASPKTERPIVLDPSAAYPVPDGYVMIETELDWMRSFSISDSSPYWVRGKALCEWAEEWLICWNRSQLIADIKSVPRERLANFLQPIPVPSDWSEEQCLAVVVRLEKYGEEHGQSAIAQLLSAITDSELQIWTESPSIQNLAKWLSVEVPTEAKVLEQAWQSRRNSTSLERYYQTDDKPQLLKQWLKIAEPYLLDLGAYPFEVPIHLQSEFDTYWERELYRNEAQLLDSLDWNNQPAPKRIAKKAYEVLQQHPTYITKAREQKLRQYISPEQYRTLNQRHRPTEPLPLAIDASPTEALAWATEDYLPFRKWETVVSNLPQEQQVCDRLATSFEDWMLENYPKMKVDSVSSSFLNYNVSHHVHELCKAGPILWVVVDGLGWLDHQTLLESLTDSQQLQLEQILQPRFSILPTKTEYAKWSLYSQQLPSHEDWKDSAGEGFQETIGKRYTDNDVTKNRLQTDLKENKYRLYCWDTDEFDSLFHKQVDWQELYAVKRKRAIKGIADDVLRFLKMHPQHEEMSVVIASDHGQLMGTSTKLSFVLKELTPKGRMAIGRADDPQLAILDKDCFDLPHDISVVRGPKSFNSFSYADDKSVIGCHGGLYPEEVVVGFSVLKSSVKRFPVLVKCFGSGKAGEPHLLKVEINNPNALPIENCKLYIEQLPSLQEGQTLRVSIAQKACRTIDVEIPQWPELPPTHEGKMLTLTGRLEFYYRDAEFSSSDLDRESKIEVSQMFSSGMQEGLDDFF
ncbi:MAG: serine/threonine-protein kinase, partial [Phormidesmis sp.]